jgi:hypothetical protein
MELPGIKLGFKPVITLFMLPETFRTEKSNVILYNLVGRRKGRLSELH